MLTKENKKWDKQQYFAKGWVYTCIYTLASMWCLQQAWGTIWDFGCVCLRQLDIHLISKKGKQHADKQMCVFNTFLPALPLWVNEQHLHQAEAALICSKQLLIADVQGGEHCADTSDGWDLHTPAWGAMEKPPHRCPQLSSGCRVHIWRTMDWYQGLETQEPGDPGEQNVKHGVPAGTYPCRSTLGKGGAQREKEN